MNSAVLNLAKKIGYMIKADIETKADALARAERALEFARNEYLAARERHEKAGDLFKSYKNGEIDEEKLLDM